MPDSTALYQKFSKDVLILGASELIMRLRGLIMLPLIAKLLGAAAYGMWSQAHVTLSLVGTFASLGIGFSFTRFFAGETDREKIRQGFFSILIAEFGWACLIAIVFFLFAGTMAERFFGGREAINIVYLVVLILPFYSISPFFTRFFTSFRRMGTSALIMLAQGFGGLAIAVALVLAGWGVFGAVLSLLIAFVLSEIIVFSMIAREIGVSFPRLSSFVRIKDYLRFGLPLIPSGLAQWVTSLSDRYVIAAFLGIASTGIYSAAYGIGFLTLVYIGPIGRVLLPTVTYLHDNKQIQDVKKHLTYSLKYYLLLAIPSAVGLFLLAKPILQILATAEFAAAGPVVVPFVAMSAILGGCITIIHQPLMLVKRTGVIGIAWGIAAVLNLGLNLLFVPRFGIIAAAITTLISYAFATGLISYKSFKYLKFDIDWIFILKSLLATAVMSGVILQFTPAGLSSLLVTIVVGALVYFAMIFLLRGISKQEILLLRKLAVGLIPSRKR